MIVKKNEGNVLIHNVDPIGRLCDFSDNFERVSFKCTRTLIIFSSTKFASLAYYKTLNVKAIYRKNCNEFETKKIDIVSDSSS